MEPDLKEGYDLLVAGGGPAGAVAARTAAEKGLRVLMVEAKDNLGERCHCAEWVPSLLALEVEIGARVRCAELSRLVNRAGSRTSEARVSGLVLERKIWEKDLALAAARAGAEVRSGIRFMGWTETGLALLRGPWGRAEVRAGSVVAADGGLSRVASSLGLARNPGVPAVQIEVDAGPELKNGLVLFREDLFGYLWLFPKGKSANLGLGGKMWGQTGLEEMLAQWRAEAMGEGLIGPSILRRGGGFIPVGGPRERVLGEVEGTPVFLAGDAAGLTHPTTGAGIPQAVRSGMMAGEAAAGYIQGRKEAPAEYQESVRRFLGGYLRRGLKLRDKAAGLWARDFEEAVKTYWPPWPRRERDGNP